MSKLLGTGLAAALIFIAGCTAAAPDFNGTLVDPPADPAPFELASATGTVSSSDLERDWMLLFFGYTNCPDVCPATMTVLKRAYDQLEEHEQEQVQVAMISVDPERDTPGRLASYTSAFDSSFIGMTGTQEQIEQLTSAYGIYYKPLESVTGDDNYYVDHTAAILLVDSQSRMRMVWSYGTPHEDIASDLQQILN